MYCVKCGKEIKNATAFCSYCGDKIMNKNTMVNSNGVKEYNDFSRDMVIALFIGICILIKMMIGMAVLIVWTHWPLISTIIESFIRR